MGLTHIDEETGDARMVDVSAKPATLRQATAGATVRMQPDTYAAIKTNALKKGDALAVARIAGIMAAKRTPEIIPLCHSLPLSHVGVDFEFGHDGCSIAITASASTTAATGVEMEALTAATVAALTLYDMAKAADRGMTIEAVRLLRKTGGKSGDYRWTT